MWWIAPVVGAAYGSMFGLVRENADAAVAGAILGIGAGLIVEGVLTLPAIEMPTIEVAERTERVRRPEARVEPEAMAPGAAPVEVEEAGPLYAQSETCMDAFANYYIEELELVRNIMRVPGTNTYLVELTEPTPAVQQEVVGALLECHPDLVDVKEPALIEVRFGGAA